MSGPSTSPAPAGESAFNRLKACRHGLMLYNVNDLYIGRSLDQYGEFSEGEVDLFRQLVHPGAVVVEVGANIGAHSVFFGKQVGPAGRVLAFEPQRIIFYTLCANVALNSLTNVWCYPHAVGAQPGAIVVPALDYTRRDNFGGLSLGGFQTGERVPVVTVDNLGLPRCDLIKADVEGMEQAVLRGAVHTIIRFKPVLYVENDRPDRSADLVRFIDSLGYAMYWHTPYLYNPHNFLGNPENVFGKTASVNMLCVHRSISVQFQTAGAIDVPPAGAGTIPMPPGGARTVS